MKRISTLAMVGALLAFTLPALAVNVIGVWQSGDSGDGMAQRVEDSWNTGGFSCNKQISLTIGGGTTGFLDICRVSCAPSPAQCPSNCGDAERIQIAFNVPGDNLSAAYDFGLSVNNAGSTIVSAIGSAPANTIGAPAVDVLFEAAGERDHCRGLRCRGDVATDGLACDAATDCGSGVCSGVCVGGGNDGNDCASQAECFTGACVPPIRTCSGGSDPGKNCLVNQDCSGGGSCVKNIGECKVIKTHDAQDGSQGGGGSVPLNFPALGSWTLPLVGLVLVTGVWFAWRRFTPAG